MCYRENVFYVVMCDRCGQSAPAGDGWWTPTLADRAAGDAGWVMTRTEHLCPPCLSSAREMPLGFELRDVDVNLSAGGLLPRFESHR